MKITRSVFLKYDLHARFVRNDVIKPNIPSETTASLEIVEEAIMPNPVKHIHCSYLKLER